MRTIPSSLAALCAHAGRMAAAAGVAVLLFAGDARAQSDVLWRRTMPQPVQSALLDAEGHVLIRTGDAITALDPDSGTLLWGYSVHGSIPVFRYASTRQQLVGNGHTLASLDVVTGIPAWRRGDLPDLGETWVSTDPRDSIAVLQTRNGFAVLDLVNGTTLWDSTALPRGTVVREFFRFPDLKLLLLVARTPAAPVTLMAVTMDSGAVRWSDAKVFRKDVKFKRSDGVEYAVVHPPVTLSDSSVVLYFTTEGPLRLDLRTGEVLWRSQALSGAPVPATRDDYPPSQVLDSLLIVPAIRQLVAFDIGTGQVRWVTAGELPNSPSWLTVDSSGIATGNFRGGKTFFSVFGADGVRRVAADTRLSSDVIGLIVNDTMFLGRKDRLSDVPLESGVEHALAPIGFQGDDYPTDIDSINGGGLVLMGRQNLVRINRDGTVVYRRFYPAPPPSFWDVAASALVAVGGAVSHTYAYLDLPDYAWSAKARDYYYIFTAKADSAGKKGFSLVALDRKDGRELGRMWFNESSPYFLLNGGSGTVYEVEENTKVIARRFAGFPALKPE